MSSIHGIANRIWAIRADIEQLKASHARYKKAGFHKAAFKTQVAIEHLEKAIANYEYDLSLLEKMNGR